MAINYFKSIIIHKNITKINVCKSCKKKIFHIELRIQQTQSANDLVENNNNNNNGVEFEPAIFGANPIWTLSEYKENEMVTEALVKLWRV
ncbi:hypothetical protein BLOT_010651 [Blomia tropicalis]|nr:hypothetical protein BLOT_010651 [Blomia tropicalis]